MLLFRVALEKTQLGSSSADVLSFVTTADVATPIYYVVAGTGPGEAALVARGLHGTECVVRFGDEGATFDTPNWALVQANTEVWQNSSARDRRRFVATRLLERYGL